jgi:hypothetical protein
VPEIAKSNGARHIDVDDQDIGSDQPVDLAHLVAAQRDVRVVALVAHARGERMAPSLL